MFRGVRLTSGHRDPWRQPLSERVAWLARGPRRVAYVSEGPEYGTFRYRVFNMVDALNRASLRASAAWFFREEWDEVIGLMPTLDAVVIGRCRYDFRLDALVSGARVHGVPIIYDVDDLVVDAELVPLLVHTHGLDPKAEDWDFWYAYVGRLEAALQLCDRSFVTTPVLAQHLRLKTGKPVSVIPNFMNRRQLVVSRSVFDAKCERAFAVDAPIHVGYFSGTASHAADFAIVSDALARLLARERRVRVRCVGHIEIRGPLAGFRVDRVDREPFQHFLRLQQLVGVTEVNLIPLQANDFTDCKSELKYFEAAAVGTVSIASPTATYRAAISDGENGLLAREHEWEEKLGELTEDLLSDRRRYQELARAAHRDAISRYSWERQVGAIEDALFGDSP